LHSSSAIPPFDSFLLKEKELVDQWIATFGELPEEWRSHPVAQGCDILAFRVMHADEWVGLASLESVNLSQWLREIYFDD
jgi:hypothetical protein